MNIPKPPAKGKPNTGMMQNQPIVVVKPRTPKDNRKPVSPRAGRACPCHEDDLVLTHASGYDGVIHPVGICLRCHRISFDDDATELRSSKGEDVFAFRGLIGKDAGKQKKVGSFPSLPRPAVALMKALGAFVTEPMFKDYVSDPEAHGLRWITVHPNGDDSKGVPILVHDNGTEYTVVGGAGGKMNQMVLKKPKGAETSAEMKARREARAAKRKERTERLRAEMGEDEVKFREEASKLREEAKAKTASLKDLIHEKLGTEYDESAMSLMRREAQKRALAAMPHASPKQVDEFVEDAVKKQKQEDKKAVNDVINQVVEDFAKQGMGEQEGGEGTKPIKVRAGGRDISFQLDEDTFQEAASLVAAATSLANRARAIEKALDGDDEEAVRGIELLFHRAAPSEAEKQELIRKKYLDNDSVAMHTRLVRESEGLDEEQGAGPGAIMRGQNSGALDALNNYVYGAAGHAVLSPDIVKQLGVENAAAVTAAYLAKNGHNTEEAINDLLHRVAVQSTAAIAARFEQIGQMDENVEAAYDAAYVDDEEEATLTKGQAHAVKGRATKQKHRLLNITRGQLRSAAALAFFMENADRAKPIFIDGGTNEIAAHEKAKGLGLKDGDYTIARASLGEGGEGGSYKVKVEPQNLHKLARKISMVEHQRNAEMDNLREDVAERTVAWSPEGFNKDITLQPHQELGARAIVQQKRMVLNMGAGTGKTPTMYAAAAELLSTGKIDRVLMTMPAKPRAQQEDGVDMETGKWVQGEKNKFLSHEMSGQFVTVTSGAELKKALAGVKAGTIKGIITSPQMLRDNYDKFTDAGFGGERSAYFADEIHDYGVTSAAAEKSDGSSRNVDPEKASGQTRACRNMARSEYFVAGSGTLVRSSATDLHEVMEMVSPGALGGRKQFTEEWERLARGRTDVFSAEAMDGMRARLSGYMTTYHKPPQREGEDGNREAVPLTADGDGGKPHAVVPLPPEDRRKIRKVLAQYEKDRLDNDKEKRKGAAFKRDGAIQHICDVSAAKMDFVVNRLRTKMEHPDANGNHKTLIFCTKTTPLAALRTRIEAEFPGVPIVEINGGVNDEGTRAAMNTFNDHDGHVICLATASANYGVNLQGGKKRGTRDVIEYHNAANQAQSHQVICRQWRNGQDNEVTHVRVISDQPMERQKNYRIQHVQSPQQDLLGDLASAGEYSALMAAHIDDIKAVAHA